MTTAEAIGISAAVVGGILLIQACYCFYKKRPVAAAKQTSKQEHVQGMEQCAQCKTEVATVFCHDCQEPQCADCSSFIHSGDNGYHIQGALPPAEILANLTRDEESTGDSKRNSSRDSRRESTNSSASAGGSAAGGGGGDRGSWRFPSDLFSPKAARE
jgi:uncharacterized membrane protein YgcG